MQTTEGATNRRHFLRQLGVAVGVAVGAAALPGAGNARTDSPVCCLVSCMACDFPAK
jgi:phosphoribosylcarboxyaminoimidazole (NCAIR) mutase